MLWSWYRVLPQIDLNMILVIDPQMKHLGSVQSLLALGSPTASHKASSDQPFCL